MSTDNNTEKQEQQQSNNEENLSDIEMAKRIVTHLQQIGFHPDPTCWYKCGCSEEVEEYKQYLLSRPMDEKDGEKIMKCYERYMEGIRADERRKKKRKEKRKK